MTIGSLAVNVVAKTNKFSKPITRARLLMRSFVASVKVATIAVAVLGAAVAAIATGALIGLGIKIRRVFSDVGDLAKGTVTELSQKIKDMGLALDSGAVRAIVRANDAVLGLKASFEALFRHIAAEFAPLVELVAGKLTGILANRDRVKSIAGGFVGVVIKGIGLIGNTIQSAVVGLLRLVGAGLQFFNEMKNGPLGRAAGLSAVTKSDFLAQLKVQNAATRLGSSENKFSGVLDTLISGIKSDIDKNLRNESLGRFFDFLGKKVPTIADAVNATQGALSGFKRKVELARDGVVLAFIKNQLFGKAAKEAKATKTPASSPIPRLAALEAGSAEAFAASRKNLSGSPAKSLEKLSSQQLDVQKSIRDGIDKLANTAVPEFAI